jgi:hypothetical protein
MLYCSINEERGEENAEYFGRLCDPVFVNYPEQFTDVEGGYPEEFMAVEGGYPGRYPYSTSVNTFVGVVGVAVGTADPGKMVGSYVTHIACRVCRQKSRVVK